jgi:hypothetical protein
MTITDNHRETLYVADSITGLPISLKGDSTNGSLLTTLAGGTLVDEAYDYIGATYPDGVTEVYTYKLGGSGGTTVATVTVVYTTTVKDVLTSVTRT